MRHSYYPVIVIGIVVFAALMALAKYLIRPPVSLCVDPATTSNGKDPSITDIEPCSPQSSTPIRPGFTSQPASLPFPLHVQPDTEYAPCTTVGRGTPQSTSVGDVAVAPAVTSSHQPCLGLAVSPQPEDLTVGESLAATCSRPTGMFMVVELLAKT